MTTFDLTGWTRIAVTGADAAKFLQNFCTNDLLKALSAENPTGCEAFFTSEKARVLGHGWLLPAEDGVTFVGTPGQGPGLVAHLSKYALMEDVEFADRTGAPLCYIPSPAAEEDAVPSAFPTGDLLAHGTFGFDVPQDATPLSESARIAAKLPAVGVDLTDANLCMEADRPWAISYTKGCYLGQEPVARVRALGKVNKLLCRMHFDEEPRSPAPGTPIAMHFDDERAQTPDSEKPIGTVTSVAGRYVMGLMKRAFASDGTEVLIDGQAATVF